MKTGGTLNFLKRAGAILMLLAIFASSCNKYADDFKQLNTKLDALATQVAGVTQLTTDVTALKSQITALASAVAALPNPTASIAALATSLTAATTKIDAITTSLAALSTAVASKASAADIAKAVTDVTANVKAEMTKQLATLATGIADANKAILAAQAANDAQTVAINKAIVDNNTAQTALLNTAMANIDAHLTAMATGTAVTDANLQSTVDALALLVKGQKTILDQLLANSNMYTGDVTITSVPEMRFFYSKLSQMGIVNGNVTVTTTNLTAKMDTVNMITSKIASVIGTGKNVVITTVAGTTLDLSKLVNVSGAYTVTGVDVSDDNLTTVGGAVTLSYPGAYNLPNLSSVGGTLTLFNVLSTATGTPSLITSINVPNATATGLSDGGTVGVVSYPKATSIVLGGGVPVSTSLTAAAATTITLGTATIDNLTITAGACTNLSIANATTASGTVIITAAGCAINLDKVKTSTAGLTITGPTTLYFPVMTSGGITSTTATTVNLPLHAWATAATLPAVTSLTLGKVATLVAAGGYPTLTSLSVTGTPSVTFATLLGSVTTTASNTVLASVTLGGNLSSAVITGCAKLASLSTAGVINSLTIDSNAILAGVNLAHTHLVGSTGSELIVTSNPKLTALNSGILDYPKTITVTGNTLLTSLTLSSYVTKLNEITGSMTTITIGSNGLSGAYTQAVAATPTTAYVPTTITSADLHTLKAFVASYKAAYITLNVNLDAVKIGSGTAATLATQMAADAANTASDATGAITTLAEFALVQ